MHGVGIPWLLLVIAGCCSCFVDCQWLLQLLLHGCCGCLVAAVVSLIVSGCCSGCWLLWLLAAVVVGWLLCCWLQQEQPRKLELLARRAALLHRASALTKCSQI